MKRAAALIVCLAVSACGASVVLTPRSATDFFRQTVGQHYHGPVATGDFRGCVKVTATRFSCTAYVRGRGIDVLGTVTVHDGGNMLVSARSVSGAAIQAWFQKTGGTSF